MDHDQHGRSHDRDVGRRPRSSRAPEPDATLDCFLSTSAARRSRVGGAVSERLGYGRESIPGGALAWTNWIAGIVAVYSTLFGLGKLVFGQMGQGFALLAVAAVAFAVDRAVVPE